MWNCGEYKDCRVVLGDLAVERKDRISDRLLIHSCMHGADRVKRLLHSGCVRVPAIVNHYHRVAEVDFDF